MQEEQTEILGRNEIFGAVGPHRMPVTCDTGAEVTVVPEEAVEQEQLTGETCELHSFNAGKSIGKRCKVQISVDGTTFTKEAVTQPGKDLGWSVCLSLNLTDPEGRDFLMKQITRRAQMTHEEALYIPPEVREGILVSGIPVREAKVVKSVKGRDKSDSNKVEEPVQSTSVEAQKEDVVTEEDVAAEEEVDVDEVVVVNSGDRVDGLEKDEVVGDALGGSADLEGSKEFPVATIREGMPRE